MVLILLGFINILTLEEFLNYFCKQKKIFQLKHLTFFLNL
jgi:hypothetical protein